MSLDPKISGLIGFGARSGKLMSGSNAVEQGIRSNRAKLVILAEDLNPKRVEKMKLWCADMGIPVLVSGKKDEYGTLLQKPPLGLLALTDAHMVSGILKAAKTNGGD